MQMRNLSPSKMKPTTTSQSFWLWSLTTLTTKSTLTLLSLTILAAPLDLVDYMPFHSRPKSAPNFLNMHVHKTRRRIPQCSLYFCLGAMKPTCQVRVGCDPSKTVTCVKWKSGSRLASSRLRPCVISLCPLISSALALSSSICCTSQDHAVFYVLSDSSLASTKPRHAFFSFNCTAIFAATTKTWSSAVQWRNLISRCCANIRHRKESRHGPIDGISDCLQLQ